MLGLDSKRYVPVPLRRSKQSPCLIHPLFFPVLAREARFLERQIDVSVDQWRAKDHFFERREKNISHDPLPESWEELEAMAQKLSLETADIPSVSDDASHVKALEGVILGMTDLFHPRWNTVNIGSSRNVLLSETQIKGCGRTLPVNNFWHRLSSGTSLIRESVHSFLISHILDVTLPLGALPALAVYLDPGSQDGKSLYLRTADSIRLAQIPEKPEDSELAHMRAVIGKTHPGSSPSEVVARVMAQFATNAFLGAALQSTPDNLLLDGKPLDEEEWQWPREPGQISFHIGFDWEKKSVSDDLTPDMVPWDKVTNIVTTFSVFRKSIRLYLEGLGSVYNHGVSQERAEEMFLNHLKVLFANYGVSPEELGHWWQEGCLIQNGRDAEKWIRKYASKWHFRLGVSQPPGKYFFRFSPATLDDFKNLGYQSYGSSFEAYQKIGVLRNNSFQLSKKLLSVAARASHWLPVTVDEKGQTIPNIMSLEAWWKCEKGRLGNPGDRLQHLIFLNQKNEEITVLVVEDIPQFKEPQGDFLPIAAVFKFKEGEIEIPLRKTKIRPS